MRLLSSIICIILSLVIFFGFTNARYTKTEGTRTEIARFDDALSKAAALASLRDSLKEKYNSFPQSDIQRLDTLIPDTIDTVRLIIDINAIAKRHGLSVLNINVDGAPDKTKKSAGIGPENSPYGAITVSFNVITTYERFKDFIAELESSLRLIDINEVTLGELNPITGTMNYSIKAQTYWLR